jgi:transposase-like protein
VVDCKDYRFKKDIIPAAVLWRLAYPLSYRNLYPEEMMAERGVPVDHSSIYRWVHEVRAETGGCFPEREEASSGFERAAA